MLRVSGIHWAAILIVLMSGSGCSLVPDVRKNPQFHNPFPQLKRVAVLPFFNQSGEPTLNQDAVAQAYYSELQSIPGFEVLPVGVTKLQWHQFTNSRGEPMSGQGFQEFARYLNVDAVIVGAVTDYTPYYPPRLAMTVHWYAANPGFHPIPMGYGLPWGTPEEKHIPRDIVLETEFEIARKQLETQTPVLQGPVGPTPYQADDAPPLPNPGVIADTIPEIPADEIYPSNGSFGEDGLPAGWPDPTGLIPNPPSANRPPMQAQPEPVLSHTRIYHSTDAEFTQKLADRFYADDDARFGGWQSYLSRSDDFIRFCSYLHITEMLESRGGKHKSDLIFRWPISRYFR